MWTLLKELDRILRGEATRLPDLREGTIRFPLGGVAFLLVLLAMTYGFFMGWFSLFNRIDTPTGNPEWQQVPASIVKVPLLFLATLIVTYPSLYVFNTLVGSRLRGMAVMRLLIASLAVIVTVLASFGPIVAFFSITTDSYSFMVLLNVAMFAVAGILGLSFLLQTLHRLSVAVFAETDYSPPPPPPPPLVVNQPGPAGAHPPLSSGALDRLDGHSIGPNVRAVFRAWIVLFGLVGAQMAWILRPFIGHPAEPFTWLRPRQSNFFQAVWHHFLQLFGGS